MASREPHSDAPFDLDRLDPLERELWDRWCSDPVDYHPVIRVYEFAQICMLQGSGPPEVVGEYLAEHDPDALFPQYLENVRRAYRNREKVTRRAWRDELDCERCREWTGKPPIPLKAVEKEFRREFPGIEFRVFHACYLGSAGDGTFWHIPTTVLEWSGGRYQWLPEQPPGVPCQPPR